MTDDGKGMDEEMVASIIDPFVTTRTTRKVGLGIPLFKAAAEICNGDLKIISSPGKGTHLEVEFQRSHIDRMPLGDLAGTFYTLLVAHPDIHWVFEYVAIPAGKQEPVKFIFDDDQVKEALAGVSITEPGVLSYLREWIEDGIAEVQNHLNSVSVKRNKP